MSLHTPAFIHSFTSAMHRNFHILCISLLTAMLCGLLTSCHYRQPNFKDKDMCQSARDSLTYLYERHYTWNTNLMVQADSVDLERLPVKGSYCRLYQGDRVVVAEFAIHPADSIDSIWVKLAHTQEMQGWLRECDVLRHFVPTDSISQAIYIFSDTHASYFIIVFALFIAVWMLRAFLHKRLHAVFFNDIDSLYPLLLCLLMAFSATLYESMQVFVPDTWQHFYFNPTLSPFKVPFILSVFLLSLWLFLVILLAALDDIFHQLPFLPAMTYLLGLAASCIFCYFFFIFTTPYYIGYAFLIILAWLFIRRVKTSLRTPHYRCGRCGSRMAHKGICPQCGAVNE